jgi:hypothetical protein
VPFFPLYTCSATPALTGLLAVQLIMPCLVFGLQGAESISRKPPRSKLPSMITALLDNLNLEQRWASVKG